ncbi:hypothetical protein ACTI_10720 [Actinoplanes sp. OR16]|uniref:hypothetical protein n=1 Tax=Actinoplanes sp. OR16 TaxID=946334 RepID=UPI000F6B976E|nr:hypothetical protein [Actinoplanes sp. OR16]BBH64387.1 hypothetical protein ACTI_10720 [Actinoplanes sp. OR16]
MSPLGRIAVLALVLSVSGCSSQSPSTSPTVSPPVSVSPSAIVENSPTPSASPIEERTTAPAEEPAGPGTAPGLNRQVAFATVESGGDRVLTVGSDGIVKLGEYDDRALFVAVPSGGGFLLKTGTLRAGGEAYCLQVHSPGGSNPLQLKIQACDAAEKDQVFTFPEPPADSPGRLIEVAGLFALAGPEGDKVIVQESGEGDFMTNFSVVDKGKAAIPALD